MASRRRKSLSNLFGLKKQQIKSVSSDENSFYHELCNYSSKVNRRQSLRIQKNAKVSENSMIFSNAELTSKIF